MILNSLNPAQQEAVSAPLGHQLVLAGAGSGKTRVLTHRIAWLIEIEHLSPYHILAVTFTNKAAHEMRHRVEHLLKMNTRDMWIGTFHGISHRFLRMHFDAATLPEHFQILDSDDQFRLIRRVIHGMNLDDERFSPKELQWFINAQKEEARLPAQVVARDFHMQTQLRIYEAYQDLCQKSGVIDFADLILRTYLTLQNNAELRQHYQQRFRAVLVDEFQDTNHIQYAWLKLFAGDENALTIVGDDDQSIYGWRGARIENIQKFSKDFPSANIIRLEQNYRSTGIILKAANALIEKNVGRMGKNLWTEGKDGEPITVYAGFNESDEAFYIVNKIRQLREGDVVLKEVAILYRSNAQSRVIEEALMQYGIPYRVYGGLRFFDRAEIKDALGYLRLIANFKDDLAFDRIINTPTRGIGARTVNAIREYAKETALSMWEAMEILTTQSFFSSRAKSALLYFRDLILKMKASITDLPLNEQVDIVIQQSGLIEHYKQEKGQKALTRVENLEELVNAALQFTQEGVSEDIPPLNAFLASAALESNEDTDVLDEGVQLMTLHSAKGLEFPVVFLSGLEEELFPHYLSMHNPQSIEEERRLCYVGMTRAMKKLYVTYAESRRMYGKQSYHRPSRFLKEIPKQFIEDVRFRTRVTPTVSYSDNTSKFRIGQEVHHRIFGDGVVLDFEGSGEETKVKVRFSEIGTKILIASYLLPKT